mgnify:CR=1 FL=1
MKSESLPKSWLPPTGLRFFLVVLLVVGIFFRFYNLERKIYWHDEVYTSIRSFGYTQEEVVQQVFDGRIIGIEDLQKYQRISPEKSLGDTINSLVKNPEHPPLYYLLVRFWMQLFGDFMRTPRGLSVLFSLLVFPCMYWLCLELFKSPLVGWVAVAFLAVSPFHALYAQEAREYSLWTITILLSSVALLRAMRLKTKFSWGIYGVTLALSLYTFLFSGFVAIGHGIYVVFREKLRLSKTIASYLVASGAGIIGFAPWVFVIITNFNELQGKTAWVNSQKDLSFLVKIWGLHVSAIFVDFCLDIDHPFTYLVPPVLLIGVGYAIYLLYRHTPQEVWLFVLTLIGVTAIALILPDLLLGGRRSVSSRYFVPCYIGIQLAVAYLFATQISVVSFSKQKVWQGLMAILISLGIASCAVSSQADTWWNKVVGHRNSQIARLINQAPRPLVISNTSDTNTGNVISLSYLLDSKTRFQLVVEPNIPKIPDEFSDVFLFHLSENLQEELKNKDNAKLEPTDLPGLIRFGKLQ